jgi:hypothetical protein
MTAQDAFRNWLIYCGVIGAALFGIAVLIVALSSRRERDESR